MRMMLVGVGGAYGETGDSYNINTLCLERAFFAIYGKSDRGGW
jgi:hypothetical protein